MQEMKTRALEHVRWRSLDDAERDPFIQCIMPIATGSCKAELADMWQTCGATDPSNEFTFKSTQAGRTLSAEEP